jgi:putative ABC transport system permease protein
LRLLSVLNARLAYQRGRAALSLAGIALGVALGFAVSLVNRAAVEELSAGVRSLAGDADLVVRGARSGFDETLFATLARLPGVAAASPVLELEAALADGRALRLVAIDPLRAARIQPALFLEDPGRRLALLRPDAVLVSHHSGFREGEKIRLVSGLATIELEVIGVLPAASLRGASALVDVATAQWRFGRLGRLNRVDLRLAPGVDREQMAARIAALLPAGTQVTGLDALEESGANLSRAYRVNLNVLALVALFTGGFLVFSAQALEVARRRPEHALLRVLGLRRAQLLRLVLLEAAAIGAAGSAFGLALGYAFARLAARYAGADLGAGFFRGVVPEIAFAWPDAAGYFVIGVAVAVAGALLPALDAARSAPAQALKAGDEARMLERVAPARAGIAFLAAGGLLALMRPVHGIPLFGYAAIGCLLVGGILLMPWLSGFALSRAGAGRNVAASLALAQLRGAPGQAVVSLAAIVASFSLMAAMAIMVASFRQSVDDWLGAVLPADLYFRSARAGETAHLDPEFEARVRALPGIAHAEFLRAGRILLDPKLPAVSLLARDSARALPLAGPQREVAPSEPPPAWISEALADLYGYRLGERIELPLAGTRHPFTVAGIWRDYARQHGAVVIDRATYRALTGDARTNDAALWLAPGTTPAAAMEALRALPGGEHLDMAGPGEIRTRSLAIFDRTFAVTYALEAVAVLVGLAGLSASVGAIVLARRREFGMLRHLGMTRGQIGAMLAAEGGVLALLGVAAGLALGGAISIVLVYVVNRQSFNWSMDLHPPYALLAALSLVLVLLSSLTAYLSGREATGMGPVRAVKEDW